MPRSTNSTNNPTLLAAALAGLELQKTRIEEQIAEVRNMLGGQSSQKRAPKRVNNDGSKAPAEKAQQKRTRQPLSAAARQRIAAAQKRRWAAFRKNQG
jgi:hypothetical protein